MAIMYCTRCEYEENCSLRDIADDLEGCVGHGKTHHRYEEEKIALQKEAEDKRNKALILSEEQLHLLKPGDKVRLIGSTISLGLKLPRYLECGELTVLGIARTGKVKCDWDGGKPFYIPPLCLEKITKGERT